MWPLEQIVNGCSRISTKIICKWRKNWKRQSLKMVLLYSFQSFLIRHECSTTRPSYNVTCSVFSFFKEWHHERQSRSTVVAVSRISDSSQFNYRWRMSLGVVVGGVLLYRVLRASKRNRFESKILAKQKARENNRVNLEVRLQVNGQVHRRRWSDTLG